MRFHPWVEALFSGLGTGSRRSTVWRKRPHGTSGAGAEPLEVRTLLSVTSVVDAAVGPEWPAPTPPPPVYDHPQPIHNYPQPLPVYDHPQALQDGTDAGVIFDGSETAFSGLEGEADEVASQIPSNPGESHDQGTDTGSDFNVEGNVGDWGADQGMDSGVDNVSHDQGADTGSDFNVEGNVGDWGADQGMDNGVDSGIDIGFDEGLGVGGDGVAGDWGVDLGIDDVGQDHGADTGVDTGVHGGFDHSDWGVDLGGDFGQDTGLDHGADVGIDDVGQDHGTDTGVDVGAADSGVDTGANGVAGDWGVDYGTDAGGDDIGQDHGADSGVDIGTQGGFDQGDWGVDNGTDGGVDDIGQDAGTDGIGPDGGMDLGVDDSGIDAGADQGSDTGGDGAGSDTGTDQGVDDGTGDEQPTVSLKLVDAEASEVPPGADNDPAIFELVREASGDEEADIPVTLLIGGTAWDLFDYDWSATGGSVVRTTTFVNGTLRQTLTATIFEDSEAVRLIATPEADSEYEAPETIQVSVLPGGYTVQGDYQAEATIHDRTVDIDLGGTGDQVEDTDGVDVLVNRDDDNDDGVEDRMGGVRSASGFVDNDLILLDLSNEFPADFDTTGSYFTVGFDLAMVRVWYRQDKTVPNGKSIGTLQNSTRIPVDASGTNLQLWVEGMHTGRAPISVTWHSGPAIHTFDSLIVNVWDLDADIDSDNSGSIAHSPWEEELEDNDHALGKLILPQAQGISRDYTSLDIDMNWDLLSSGRPDVARVRIDYSPSGKSGIIKIWKKPRRQNEPGPVSTGGTQIFPGTYSLLELGYHDSAGIDLYIEGVQAYGPETHEAVVKGGKPDDRIKVTLYRVTSTGTEKPLIVDEVKYMVVNDDTFYPNLQARRELRNAMAAQGVYVSGGSDLPQFALRLIPPDERTGKLGIDPGTSELIGEPDSVPGFKNALYRDYISGQYVMAFAGTDDWEDWVNNGLQGSSQDAPQYTAAMQIGDVLGGVEEITNKGLVFTGHSLGGGLASAASVVSGLPADTFNAAGLNLQTLRDSSGREIYTGSISNFYNAKALIDAWYLDWDILSWLQDDSTLSTIVRNRFGWMTPAIGRRHKMDGPVDIELAIPGIIGQIEKWTGRFQLSALGLGGIYMGLAHTGEYYNYGLMVREGVSGRIVWDIYGHDLSYDIND